MHDDFLHVGSGSGHVEDDGLESEDGLEQHTLTSVGIDIGSSTTQVMISSLTLRRRGSGLSTEFVVTDRQLLFASTPVLTPYAGPTVIDVDAVEAYVRRAYQGAGIGPADIDTGVVVITGEALKKENAEPISELMATWTGDFVCVSAGAFHEAVLAANGSGAVQLSEDTGRSVLNIDIGGGTTKVSLIESGKVKEVYAVSVGARLLTWDPDGTVTRVEGPMEIYAAALEVAPPKLGQVVTQEETDRYTALMADVVLDLVVPCGVTELRAELAVTSTPPSFTGGLVPDAIMFSGGVSEYIEQRETATFGDFGPALGVHLERRLGELGLVEKVVPADSGIRATVIGASQFSVQASGQTSFVSDPTLLPARGLPVVQVELAADIDCSQALRDGLARSDHGDWAGPLALALDLRGRLDYRSLRGYADALTEVAQGRPLYLVLRVDLARSLGRLITAESGHTGTVVALDGISVGELDFLDIGRPMGVTGSIPVTVKSLAFTSTHS
jgi:ethanolamine utilization protein EutA